MSLVLGVLALVYPTDTHFERRDPQVYVNFIEQENQLLNSFPIYDNRESLIEKPLVPQIAVKLTS